MRVPWTARSNQSILKEISPEYSLEGLMLELQHATLPSFTISWSVLKLRYIKSVMISNHLSSINPFSSCVSISPSIRVSSNESSLQIRWLKYQSFSISPSSENSRLISFRMDWFDSPCSPRDSQESSPTPQFKSINSSVLSFLYSTTLTSIHDY